MSFSECEPVLLRVADCVCIILRRLDRIGRRYEILAPSGRVLQVPSYYLMSLSKLPHG